MAKSISKRERNRCEVREIDMGGCERDGWMPKTIKKQLNVAPGLRVLGCVVGMKFGLKLPTVVVNKQIPRVRD